MNTSIHYNLTLPLKTLFKSSLNSSSIPSTAMAPATDLSLLPDPGPIPDVGVQIHTGVQR